jgi:SpoVK/Ycf46/Vps4 family AAA+-type ATPase
MLPTTQKNQPKNSLIRYFADLAQASLTGDTRQIQLILLAAVRGLKKNQPECSEELGKILATFSANPGALRRANNAPPPEDSDAGMPLLSFPSLKEVEQPTFSGQTHENVEQFLNERRSMDLLLAQGIEPPRSILLEGVPGTGKTALAAWIATSLNLPLVVLDLATTVSSYLGKTGSNLKRSLDYARVQPCVFLLDEFDSIAKRRDHSDDVGELKRIVTVLLKELENWPFTSVLVAATNHPDLLDPAIERRFDVVLTIPIPSQEAREKILISKMGSFSDELAPRYVSGLSKALDGRTGSEIETMVKAALRRHIVKKTPLGRALGEVVCEWNGAEASKDQVHQIIKLLKHETKLTVREIATIVGLSPSGVQHHLKKSS